MFITWGKITVMEKDWADPTGALSLVQMKIRWATEKLSATSVMHMTCSPQANV